MFRCDFDVTKNLKISKELNTARIRLRFVWVYFVRRRRRDTGTAGWVRVTLKQTMTATPNKFADRRLAVWTQV